MTVALRAEVVEAADYHAAVEDIFERGWTDGLPCVPPTDDLIAAMIAASGLDGQEELGEFPPRMGLATVEKVAINAVMAGCRPAYFPVVLAAVEAMLDPRHNISGVNTTTHSCQPLTIVTGPIARAIGMNAAESVFGCGRANGTIGRAIALIRWNIGGAVPGQTDYGALSHPGRWTYCIAESDQSPWPPLHADLGLPAESSAVTVFSCEAPHSVKAYAGVQEVLHTFCNTMATAGNHNAIALGETLVVLNPYIARLFADAGWSKRDIRGYLWQHARQPVRRVRDSGGPLVKIFMQRYWPKWLVALGDDELAPLTERPEQIHIVVTGGATYFCAWVPGWGNFGGYAITRPVRQPSQ